MLDGTENEKYARAAVEVEMGVMIDEVALVDHPTIARFSCSPDGVFGDCMIQIKAPQPPAHLAVLLAKAIPSEYLSQMFGELAVTGRRINYFCSYCEAFPQHLRLCIIPLHRDEARIKEIERAVIVFNDEVDGVIKQLNNVSLPSAQQANASSGGLSTVANASIRNAGAPILAGGGDSSQEEMIF